MNHENHNNIAHVVHNNCLQPVMILVLWVKAKKGERGKGQREGERQRSERRRNTKELLEREDSGDIIPP